MSKIVPDRFAVMTVDPGGTSGCSQGIFRTDRGDDMMATVLKRALKKKQITSWEVKGIPAAQAWSICEQWIAFRFKCSVEYQIAFDDIHLVIEAFQLRKLQADLYPVMVIHGIETLLYRDAGNVLDGKLPTLWPVGRPEYQEPSTGKHMDNKHLKRLEVWAVGSPHERDALRHLVQKVNAIL